MKLSRFNLRPFYLHYYFLILYSIPILLSFTSQVKIIVMLALAISSLLFLSTYWTIKSKLFQCYSSNPSGKYILYEKEICLITKEPLDSSAHFFELKESSSDFLETFFYNREKYLIGKSCVSRIEPRLDFPFEAYKKKISHSNYILFPFNDFKVPNPSFFTLFKEQAVSPLFCFQIFSSLLMCFDEYVLQSIFSTCMIILVEAGMVFSRVSTMKMFRTLEQKKISVKRIATGKPNDDCFQETVDSYYLKPGDRIVLDSICDIPCDLLITKGSGAVNEAMLSGESVPLIKESISDGKTIFNSLHHKKHILYAGTNLEKIIEPIEAVVLKTSFSTEQGNLLRKMLKSEDIKYDPEALKFVLVLSFIGIINSVFTYIYSPKAGYPLFLDIIVLFSNSIPFELPMEMGMSIQSAVKTLMAKKIYCLEPFRITLAGKIDVCCFDKTGTLTDSELDVKSIEYVNDESDKILLCCNDLINIDGKTKGDPLDIAILKYFEAHKEFKNFKTIKKFPFSSELRRQSVLADFEGEKFFALKGAPETVQSLLTSVPSYFSKYKDFSSQGFRVIAMAYKKIDDNVSTSQKLLEKDLIFAGFILFGSKIKDFSIEMCKILEESNHKVIMITGDNLLTALCVAEQLGLKQNGVEGIDIDKALKKDAGFFTYNIFARASPIQKELIIKKYQKSGHHVMMVGDGTNDVGALKAADVGVAMLECKLPQEIKISTQAPSILSAFEEQQETLKPGDASVAAPFTVKSNSLKSIVEIIQQGRSSLVTTIQMYKILALNSITSAFLLSFIDIIGIKFSEYQMLGIGLLSALAFSAISSGKTLPTISKQRPQVSIFTKYFISSIIGQSIVHILSFCYIYLKIERPAPAKSFQKSIMNTVLFILSSSQTVSCFICNFIGRPFREDIWENKLLGISLVGIVAFVINILVDYHHDLNEMMGVVPLGYRNIHVSIICLLDSILSYAIERICFKFLLLEK